MANLLALVLIVAIVYFLFKSINPTKNKMTEDNNSNNQRRRRNGKNYG